MTRWIIEPGVFDAGDIGGDGQMTDAHSVRLRPRDDRRSMITISLYGFDPDPNRAGTDGTFEVVEQVELIVGTDPEDVGSTEVWSDIRYVSIFSKLHAADLDGIARHCAVRLSHPKLADWVDWDGREGWHGDVDPLSDERWSVYDVIENELG